jgi:tetratricopeptide (TPR) repeat protein
MFGLKPWGHHLTSVLLHAVNTVLVFLLLRSLTGALWRSLLVAAVFGLHPLHVESVAWVSERKDVLSTFFALLTLWAYARYAQCVTSGKWQVTRTETAATVPDSSRVLRHPSLFYWLALVFFALGLMSKPMLVTWPFVMLLLDYWPLGRVAGDGWRVAGGKNGKPSTLNPVKGRGRVAKFYAALRGSTLNQLLFEKLPFFGLAAVTCIVTFVVQNHSGAMKMVQNLPLGARSGNALISYCRYLGKLFWPADLAIFYPHPGYWPLEQVLLAGGLILGFSALLFVKRRRFPFLLMGWLWFCGTLVPVIGLVQVGEQAMADRYTYIPSLGLLILAIWGACELTRRWRYQVIALSAVGWAAIILCLGLTRQQLGYWQDSETLFQHVLAVTENNYLAHNGLGVALDRKSQTDEAIRQYQEAIRLKPDFASAHYNLGNALGEKGQTDEAIRQYQEAIRLAPDNAAIHDNLGSALLKKNQIDEAIRQYQEAIRLKPDYANAYNNLGTALNRKGQTDEAIRQFQEAIRLAPDFANAYNNLGTVLGMKGQIDEAINQYQEAIRLKPDYASAHYNLGTVLGMKGQTDEAIRQFQEVIRLKPDYAEAHNNLGIALGRTGQTDEAIREFQEAIRLKPDYVEAHNNLARVLGMKNIPAGR